MMKLYQKFKLM